MNTSRQSTLSISCVIFVFCLVNIYLTTNLTDSMSMTQRNPITFVPKTLASLIVDFASPELVTTLSTAMHSLLNDVDEHPFMRRKIREILFEGWSLTPYIEIIIMLSELAEIPLPTVKNLFQSIFRVKNSNCKMPLFSSCPKTRALDISTG